MDSASSARGAGVTFSALRGVERQRNYFLMLGIAETATLGAFLAQDLILFVLFSMASFIFAPTTV